MFDNCLSLIVITFYILDYSLKECFIINELPSEVIINYENIIFFIVIKISVNLF